jgi:DNA-binding CsgD family transcriptional regulator
VSGRTRRGRTAVSQQHRGGGQRRGQPPRPRGEGGPFPAREHPSSGGGRQSSGDRQRAVGEDRRAEAAKAAAGMHRELIAGELGISARTVDQHFATMFQRARAESRVELIAKCFAAGVLLPGSSAAEWQPVWSGKRCLASRS